MINYKLLRWFMREVTQNMIKKYLLLENKFDFMGYYFDSKEELSFHHLVIAKSKCEEYGILGGYYEWNGAILVRLTSHNYLHLIERVDKGYLCSRPIIVPTAKPICMCSQVASRS